MDMQTVLIILLVGILIGLVLGVGLTRPTIVS